MIDHFLDGLTGGAHGDDDIFRIGRSDIIEKLVIAAGQGAHLLHVLIDDAGELEVIGVDSLATLVIDVRILGRAAQFGTFGIGSPGAESGQRFLVDQFGHIRVVDEFDLLDFVAGAEPVEKVDKWQAAFNGGQVGHQAQVHGLLNRSRCDHAETGLPDGHHILVIAENAQRMGGYGAGRDVQHAGQQLAAHFIHVGDHQQQALGGREGACQGAGSQRSVDGGRCSSLTLHLAHQDSLAENVLASIGRPLIANFADGRGGRDRINRRRVAHGIGHMGCSRVAVYRFHSFCHRSTPFL